MHGRVFGGLFPPFIPLDEMGLCLGSLPDATKPWLCALGASTLLSKVQTPFECADSILDYLGTYPGQAGMYFGRGWLVRERSLVMDDAVV